MSSRPEPRILLAGVALLALAAPAAAQNQNALFIRTFDVLAALCGSSSVISGDSCHASVSEGDPGVQVQSALQIAPREASGAGTTATQTTDVQVGAQQDRLEQARVEAAEGEGPSRFGAFATGTGGFGTVDESGENEEYDVYGAGFAAGVDHRFGDHFVGGVGFGWNHQSTEFDELDSATGSGAELGGGEIDADSYTGSLYGSFFHGPLYVDGMVAYTYVDYEFDRPLDLVDLQNNPFSATAKGDTHAHQLGASGEIGYEIPVHGLTITPSAGVSYRSTWIDDYTESGGGPFPLSYDDQRITSVLSSVGGDVGYAISTPCGVLTPYAHASWEHEFENDARNIDARFALNDDTTVGDNIRSRTSSPDRDYARVGGGIAAQFANGIAGFVDYDTVLGLSKVEHHRFSLGLRLEF